VLLAMDAESPKTSALYAAHKHIAVSCNRHNRAFQECKKAHEDPAHCIAQGKEVMSCVKDLCAPPRPQISAQSAGGPAQANPALGACMHRRLRAEAAASAG